MLRQFFAAVFLAVLIVPSASAEEPITRREGFLHIWESIKRPVEPTRLKPVPYTDVTKDSKGYAEITYAKHRSLLDEDGGLFYPEQPLAHEDAFLWLIRLNNVDDIRLLTRERLPDYFSKYPVASSLDRHPLTAAELTALIGEFTDILKKEPHEISFYAENFHGKGTAFGEPFDMYAPTAAHRTYPYNTVVKVTNIENGKSVTVRINDRGPFVKGRDMDLSLAMFETITTRSRGKIMATFERLGDAKLIGFIEEPHVTSASSMPRICRGTNHYQTRIARGVTLDKGVPKILPPGSTLELTGLQTFIVMSIRLPHGVTRNPQEVIDPGEIFSLTPEEEGKYVFVLETTDGKRKRMVMQVKACNP